jgi:hypothetical protein
MSNCARMYWMVRMVYVYSWGISANWRNSEVGTRAKRGMATIGPSACPVTLSEQTTRTNNQEI